MYGHQLGEFSYSKSDLGNERVNIFFWCNFFQGHAMAGGCVLGLSCDYRVMAEGFRIGMVEIEAVSYY